MFISGQILFDDTSDGLVLYIKTNGEAGTVTIFDPFGEDISGKPLLTEDVDPIYLHAVYKAPSKGTKKQLFLGKYVLKNQNRRSITILSENLEKRQKEILSLDKQLADGKLILGT
jgi:hypothetical protein